MEDYLLDKQRPVFGLKAILLTVGIHAVIGAALYLSGRKTPDTPVTSTPPPTTQTFPKQVPTTKPLERHTKSPAKPVKYP